MYHVIFLFDIGEVLWRIDEIVSQQLVRRPKLLKRLTPLELRHAWLHHFIERQHFVAFERSNTSEILQHVDADFLAEDAYLMRTLYWSLQNALHPGHHPCFEAPCTFGVKGRDLWLKFHVRRDYRHM